MCILRAAEPTATETAKPAIESEPYHLIRSINPPGIVSQSCFAAKVLDFSAAIDSPRYAARRLEERRKGRGSQFTNLVIE